VELRNYEEQKQKVMKGDNTCVIQKAMKGDYCVICGRISELMDPVHRVPICDDMCQEVHHTRHAKKINFGTVNGISSRFQKIKF